MNRVDAEYARLTIVKNRMPTSNVAGPSKTKPMASGTGIRTQTRRAC